MPEEGDVKGFVDAFHAHNESKEAESWAGLAVTRRQLDGPWSSGPPPVLETRFTVEKVAEERLPTVFHHGKAICVDLGEAEAAAKQPAVFTGQPAPARGALVRFGLNGYACFREDAPPVKRGTMVDAVCLVRADKTERLLFWVASTRPAVGHSVEPYDGPHVFEGAMSMARAERSALSAAAAKMAKRSRANICSVLTDQKKSGLAGIGNVVKCEALHHCRVNPMTPAGEVGSQKILEMLEFAQDLIRRVGERAKEAHTANTNVDPSRFHCSSVCPDLLAVYGKAPAQKTPDGRNTYSEFFA